MVGVCQSLSGKGGTQCAVIGKKVLKGIRGTKEENVTGRCKTSLDDHRNL
jgi:hypothetical protein